MEELTEKAQIEIAINRLIAEQKNRWKKIVDKKNKQLKRKSQ